jgi:integrase
MADRPAAANNLLDRLRSLMRLAVDEEWRKDDPTVGLKGFAQKTEGFHSWTEDEIAAFERRHPLGTKARLALDLLLYTNQRKGDVVTLGRQHRAGNAHRITQAKTGKTLEIEILPELEASIAAAATAGITGALTYLVTAHGKPFSSAGFGNWFRDRCDEAGLPQCSAHGLRKAGLRRMAEGGSSNPQIKSVSGHSGDKEVAVYTAAANQKIMAERAVTGLRRPKR